MPLVIDIPKALRERLGEEGAAGLIQVLERVVDGTREDVIQVTEERFARRVAESESRLTEKIAQVESRLTEKIAQVESRLTRWMFVFWTGQLLALTGVLFAFFRK